MPFTAKVVTTTQWNARDAKVNKFDLTKPKYVVIHNTEDPNPPQDRSKGTLPGAKQLARQTQNFHMDGNGWSDSGHNFLNTTGGFILEGRHGTLGAVRKGLCIRSAHAPQSSGKLAGGNESPGIENEGTFMNFPMGQKQWDSLVDLCASLCSSCDIAPDNIRGHRDFTDTDCPGDLLYSQIPKLRQDVATKLGLSLAAGILQMGSKGSDVQQLQTILNSKGFNVGLADGIFGDITRKAVIDFQTKQGLKPDGIVGLKTRQALGL